MQNTKNSKEVQGTGIAQDQLSVNLTEKTKKLLNWFDAGTIKKDINLLLLGWVSGDAMEYFNPSDRIATFDFYTKLIDHLESVNQYLDTNKESLVPLESYELFSTIDVKQLKSIFDRTLVAFLESDFANDKTKRNSVIYSIEKTRGYVKSVSKLHSSMKLQLP